MTNNRVQWVDYAKGLTIILVVLHHTMYENLYSEPITYFNSLLVQMRMPFFFFISGLFIHKAITSEFKPFFKRKILPLLYLFILWSILRYLLDTVPRNLILKDEANLNNLLTIFIDPSGTYWYIYALLIFLLVTWFFSSIPALALCLSVFFFTITIQFGESNFLLKLARYYPLFLLGYLSSGFVINKSKKIKLYHIIFPMLFFVVLSLIKGNPSSSTPLGVFLINCAGITAGIIISVILTKFKVFSWLSIVGQNTLQIYVLHFLPLGVLKIILPKIIPSLPELAILIMLMVGVTFPLFVVKLSKKYNADWLFKLPKINLNIKTKQIVN